VTVPPTNDPDIGAIAARIRAIVSSEPQRALDLLAAALHASPDTFRQVVENRDGAIDGTLLIDVVAALIRELAVDPHWLLFGSYDLSTHRNALTLAQDRSEDGAEALRNFVRDLLEGGRA
jgi:hypothetical protein